MNCLMLKTRYIQEIYLEEISKKVIFKLNADLGDVYGYKNISGNT